MNDWYAVILRLFGKILDVRIQIFWAQNFNLFTIVTPGSAWLMSVAIWLHCFEKYWTSGSIKFEIRSSFYLLPRHSIPTYIEVCCRITTLLLRISVRLVPYRSGGQCPFHLLVGFLFPLDGCQFQSYCNSVLSKTVFGCMRTLHVHAFRMDAVRIRFTLSSEARRVQIFVILPAFQFGWRHAEVSLLI